jgi:hypothetical protein
LAVGNRFNSIRVHVASELIVNDSAAAVVEMQSTVGSLVGILQCSLPGGQIPGGGYNINRQSIVTANEASGYFDSPLYIHESTIGK